MTENGQTMAQQVALAASAFQKQLSGHAPKTVTVVLAGETLVITMHDALTPAEQALAATPAGAAKVQEFHRQLFISSSNAFRQEIARITGVDVREAAAEVETATGTVMHAFTSGTVVQLFQLAGVVSPGSWSGDIEPVEPVNPKPPDPEPVDPGPVDPEAVPSK